MAGFYVVAAPLAALVMFPYMWISGDVEHLYRVGTWIGIAGARLAGNVPTGSSHHGVLARSPLYFLVISMLSTIK